MHEQRIVGIDYGMRRVGVAIADPLRIFAQPFGTFPPDTAIEKLIEINDDEGIECIVMGWPLLPGGQEGESVHRVKGFIERILDALPEARIVKWNEEFTSELAKEIIASGEKPSMRRTGRARIDAAAAAILLQEYLNEHATTS